jgi:hypothetical protein
MTLREAVLRYPDVPLYFEVDSDCVCDDSFSFWYAESVSAEYVPKFIMASWDGEGTQRYTPDDYNKFVEDYYENNTHFFDCPEHDAAEIIKKFVWTRIKWQEGVFVRITPHSRLPHYRFPTIEEAIEDVS